jgi:sugar phosphate isomerase/epimerase
MNREPLSIGKRSAVKTALHSVSYAGVWPGQARLGLSDFLERAKTLGFDAVMLMAKRPHISVLEWDEMDRAEICRLLERLDLKVACLAGYTDFCMSAEHPEIPAREMQILYVRELARIARDLNCRLIRVFTGYNNPGVSLDQQWGWCVDALRECAQRAAEFGVTIGVQNHHDTALHYEAMFDLIEEIGEPNCKVMFDAWSHAPVEKVRDPQSRSETGDLRAAVKKLAPYIVHTTVADYVHRQRYRYQPNLVNYAREMDALRAVPMGEGCIDYKTFFEALKEIGFDGYVAYEMCSYLRGGGGADNLDRCARKFLDYISAW